MRGEFFRIAVVKLLAFIQFGMAEPRRIAAQTMNTTRPVRIVKDMKEMIGMGAIHHELRTRRIGRFIEGTYSFTERLTGR